eukprot:Skav202393  [mRNA]  locus=scaffold815:34427:36337:+ [translate_table: standard]
MPKRNAEEYFQCYGTPGVSDLAVRKIIRRLHRDEDRPMEMHSRSERFKNLEGMLQKHAETNMNTVNLQLYVDKMCEFTDVKNLLERHLLPQPGNVDGVTGCIYADEIVPGNPIAPNNKRRTWAFYFTWLPLTPLRKEFLWIPIAIIRTSEIANLPGGLPQAFTVVLDALSRFCDEGIVLANNLVLTTSLIFLGDEDALKKLGSHKGASGLRPCIKCSNCISRGNSVPGYFAIEHDRATDFEPDHDETMKDTMLHLQSLHERGVHARLYEHEKLSGWKYNPHAFCFKDNIWKLLGPSNFCYDSMHIIWGNGIANLEIGLVWQQATLHGATRDQLERFLDSAWEPSMQFGTFTCGQLKSLVNPKLLKDDGADYRGDADETLQLVVFMCFFLQQLFGDVEPLQDYIESFVALNHVCATILNMKMAGSQATSGTLLDLQMHHLRWFKKCYGSELVRPKHHYNFHVGGQTAENGVLLDCWPTERKHKRFKSDICQNVRRLEWFETSCLLRWLERDLISLASSAFTSGLLEPYRNKMQVYPGMKIGRAVQDNQGYKLRVGNILLLQKNDEWLAYQIAMCYAIDNDNFGVICEEMELLEKGPYCLWSRWKLLSTHIVLTMAEATETLRTNYHSKSNQNILLLR